MPNFEEIKIIPEIQKALKELGFIHPTEIQKKAIPLLLSAEKIDFHGQAQTGTGKTLAFLIPLLQRIDASKNVVQSVILAPTRELAIQINESIEEISKHLNVKVALIYGGVSIENQINKLRRGVHIIIGTPGRIRDHIKRRTLDLKNVKTFVLDEADIMLDMGFKEEIDDILSHVSKTREIWLFSATVKKGIAELKASYMKDPVAVQVSKVKVGTQQTEQFYCIVPFRARVHAITRFIQSISDFYGIIFCQTKILASETADELTRRGYNVGSLHGDMSQTHRNMVIKKFKKKNFTILVATDVAARGIDVADLTHVVNFSIPEDLESYVHRVGRTGRAGKEGVAITFISKSELRTINRIEKKFGVKVKPIDVPSKQMLIDTALKEVANYLTEIKPIDQPGIDSISKLIDNLSEEDLHKVTTNLLYGKFLSNLDFEEVPYTHIDQETDELQEIFINVGSEDGIKHDDIRKYLLDTKVVKEDQIKKIRVIKKRSFVKLDSDCTPELLLALKNKLLKGKRVRVNLTCLIGDGGGGDRRHRPRSRSRSRRPRTRR